MLRITLLHPRLASCLCICIAATLVPARVWADPASLQPSVVIGDADDATARAATNAPAPPVADLGTGLTPSLNLTEFLRAGSAPKATTPARRSIATSAAGKLLASIRHKGKPRLGRELGEGIASWYGPRFHGRLTANGERFDRYALTAAHKTLPLGTRVVVSNPRTGKQIVVRINDRGPYWGNRILDLSEAAASALGLKTRGCDWVVMNAVLPPSPTEDAPSAVAVANDADVAPPHHDTPTAAPSVPMIADTGREPVADRPPQTPVVMQAQAAAPPPSQRQAAATEVARPDSFDDAVAQATAISVVVGNPVATLAMLSSEAAVADTYAAQASRPFDPESEKLRSSSETAEWLQPVVEDLTPESSGQ